MSPRLLDPRTLPLNGLCLIEASAGTGKTYTIVALYLRLLLESGYDLDQILVVTFTNAATEELRGRIRQRIVEALDALVSGTAPDALLADIIAGLPDREAARRNLADTLTRLDEAAVYTIHGFCQRMLQDNAFESRVAFDAEFVTDESELRRTVIADFWRRRARSLDLLAARWLRHQWRTPAALLDELDPITRDDRMRILPEPADLATVGDLSTLADAFAALKDAWAEDRDAVVKILEKDSALNRRSYTKSVVQNAVAAMDGMLDGEMPLSPPDYFERFTPRILAEKTRDGQKCPRHEFFDRCAAFAEALKATVRAEKIRLLADARAYLSGEMARRKRQRRTLFFDDLLRLLNEALGGPNGSRLAAAIRSRFPVALIDEFQDTDPLQYLIFRRIYEPAEGCGLFLIGDPKQAIYSFRGADIFTYMQAKSDAGEQRTYTLGTNWRSAGGLVAAVNHLFSSAHRAFVFDRHIPFFPVAAGPEADRRPLKLYGKVPVPLFFGFLEK
jgi:exodeoxyribonuclease V beta subunit